MAQFESTDFKHNVSVKPVPGRMEAGSLDEMVANLMLGKDMFFKDYSEEELRKVTEILGEEVEKLEAFERTETDVGVGMVAWAAVAMK